MITRRWIFILAVVFLVAGCDSESESADPQDTADTSGSAACKPSSAFVMRPTATSGFTADKPAFTDISIETQLQTMGVTGVRINAVDFNHDTFPDLVIRSQAPGKRDTFGAGGTRYTWLLHNKDGLHFEDVTQSSGFITPRDGSAEGRSIQATIWGDIDNDGDLDAFQSVALDVNNDNGDRSELVLNDGHGNFTLASESLPFRAPSEKWPIFAATFLDYNRDGSLDLFAGYPWTDTELLPDRLFEGDGAAGFTDVSDLRGFASVEPTADLLNDSAANHNTWGVTACDLNQDGWPELMASAYGRALNGLWVGDETGFTNQSVKSGFASDHRTDWRTNLNAQCFCSLNPSATGCEGVLAPTIISCDGTLRWSHASDREPYRLGGNTFSTACADMDNDGDLDLFNFEIVHWDVGDTSDPSELLLNDGPRSAVDNTPIFKRPGNEANGLTRDWGRVDYNAGDLTGALFDFDNDGRKDVLIASSDYPGTYAALFLQKADGTFQEVPRAIGIDHKRAQGIGIADFDRDGDLDVVMGHSRARCDAECLATSEVHFFRNDIGQDGNWLQVELVGAAGSNKSAIGAQILIVTDTGKQLLEVGGGYGHVGVQHDLVQHFGLGDQCIIKQLIIRWPDKDGTIQTFNDLSANRRIRITQGSDAVEDVP